MGEGLAQGPYVAARGGVEPTTFRTEGTDNLHLTNHAPMICIPLRIYLSTLYVFTACPTVSSSANFREDLVICSVPLLLSESLIGKTHHRNFINISFGKII